MFGVEVTVEHLIKACKILEDHYIPFKVSDGHGGYCAQGAIEMAVFGTTNDHVISYTQKCAVLAPLDAAALRVYPEIEPGMTACRPDGLYDEVPPHGSVVFINNHLGKKAALKVFDDAIEWARLKEQSGKPADPEPVPEPLPEPEPILV